MISCTLTNFDFIVIIKFKKKYLVSLNNLPSLWNSQNYDFYMLPASLDIKPAELKLNHPLSFYL